MSVSNGPTGDEPNSTEDEPGAAQLLSELYMEDPVAAVWIAHQISSQVIPKAPPTQLDQHPWGVAVHLAHRVLQAVEAWVFTGEVSCLDDLLTGEDEPSRWVRDHGEQHALWAVAQRAVDLVLQNAPPDRGGDREDHHRNGLVYSLDVITDIISDLAGLVNYQLEPSPTDPEEARRRVYREHRHIYGIAMGCCVTRGRQRAVETERGWAYAPRTHEEVFVRVIREESKPTQVQPEWLAQARPEVQVAWDYLASHGARPGPKGGALRLSYTLGLDWSNQLERAVAEHAVGADTGRVAQILGVLYVRTTSPALH